MKLVGEAFEEYNSLCDENKKIPIIGIAKWETLEEEQKAELSSTYKQLSTASQVNLTDI